MKKSTIIIIAIIAVLGLGGLVIATKNNRSDPAPSNHAKDAMKKDSSETPSANDATGPDQVNIKNFAFATKKLTVKKGTKVTWTNQDDAHHDISPDKESPDFVASKLLGKGEAYSFTFAKAGTYAYHCSPHPYMKAIIEVTE